MLYQSLPLPPRESIDKLDIIDREGVPFGISIQYTSDKEFSDEVSLYESDLPNDVFLIANERKYIFNHKDSGVQAHIREFEGKYTLYIGNGIWNEQ